MSTPADTTNYRLTIVFNNIESDRHPGLKTEWGFAAWLEWDDQALLFDTGCDPAALMHNIQSLELDLDRLQTVVISHNHWDHINGLSGVLRATEYRPIVYTPASAADAIQEQHPSARVTGVDAAIELLPGIWSTGALHSHRVGAGIAEQALVILSNQGLVVVTGCSHPGIVEIVEKAHDLFPDEAFHLVTGGFHLLHENRRSICKVAGQLKELGVMNLCASHCSGKKARNIFAEEWANHALGLYLGDHHDF